MKKFLTFLRFFLSCRGLECTKITDLKQKVENLFNEKCGKFILVLLLLKYEITFL